MHCKRLVISLMLAAAFVAPAHAAETGEARFRSLYKELVETNTTASVGSCTLAAERMAARLRAAGYPDSDLTLFSAPEYPREGGLVAVYHAKDPKAKAILLLAHIDVVEAKREDWTRDPFKLVEENGNFYARGASDDKAEAAIWVDTRKAGSRFNGAEWLVQNRRDLIEASFAINEGASGELDASGKPVSMTVEAGEKTFQNYRLEITNPGGHSSRPLKDNAIYRLSAALTRLSAYEFPIQLADGSKAYLLGMAKVQERQGHADVAAAMLAIVANPQDTAAVSLVSGRDPSWAAMLHTTCVATMLDAGHAANALPQRARATVNCRIFPGVTPQQVRDTLQGVVADAGVKVDMIEPMGVSAPAPALTPAVLGPVEKLTEEFWPGVPVLPVLQSGATDGRYLNSVDIPTFGIEGVFMGPDLGHIHGLNEYIGVDSLLKGREFMYRLVKIYAEQP
jgi:acetylornithine deacetylase/succinyl-diaminopimelate desuccinylase-like protein